MPNCTRCGKKVSVFGVNADGLCADCAKAGQEELKAERERKQKEAKETEAREKEKEREAWEQKRAERPPLRAQCSGGKSVSARGSCIVIEDAGGKITAIPITSIQKAELSSHIAGYGFTITAAGGLVTESHTTKSELEASFLSDILEYIINYGAEEKS